MTPPYAPGFGDNHDSNHNIVPAMQAHIDGIAAAFNAYYPPTTNHHYLLNIDDASLPTGGVFDLRANFDPPHEFHRAGNDLDIRTFMFDAGTGDLEVNLAPGVFGNTLAERKEFIKRKIRRYVLRHGGVFAEEDELHVRFP